MAATSGLQFVFPGLAGSNASWALQQWASCGVLGVPVLSLGSAQIAAQLPYPPELCGWAMANLGLSLADASLPLDVAQTFLNALASSAPWPSVCCCAPLTPPGLSQTRPLLWR